jgi:hypothetical protein
MIRRALLLLTLAAVYIAVKRNAAKASVSTTDHAADAQWANEGGANAPTSV